MAPALRRARREPGDLHHEGLSSRHRSAAGVSARRLRRGTLVARARIRRCHRGRRGGEERMRTMQRWVIRAQALASLAVLVVTSCSSSGSRSACSTGPDYDPNVTFPYEEDQTIYPTCVDRCVASRPAPRPRTLETLPSGACDVEGERCWTSVQYFCQPTNASPGRVDGMRCTCTSGSWRCVITSPGAGTCGGVDGGAGPSDSGSG